MGDATSDPVRLSFNPKLRVAFRGDTVTAERRASRSSRRSAGSRRMSPLRSGTTKQRLFRTGGRLVRHARYCPCNSPNAP